MQLNVKKTMMMLFGKSAEKSLSLKMYNILVKLVKEFKYLGVILDSKLSFSSQVDNAIGKAKRACSRISYLIKGRYGLPVKAGINLYKSLA